MNQNKAARQQILCSDTIRLRPVEPEDVDFLMTIENDPEVWKVSQTLAPYSRFQIEQFVMDAPSEIDVNKQLRLIIEWNGNDDAWSRVGAVDLFDYDAMHQRTGLGIMVSEPHRHQGIAYTALQLVIRYAFEILLLHQLHCSVDPDNLPSIRLFEKAGFIRCGIRKEWRRTGTGWRDEWLFQRLNNA